MAFTRFTTVGMAMKMKENKEEKKNILKSSFEQ